MVNQHDGIVAICCGVIEPQRQNRADDYNLLSVGSKEQRIMKQDDMDRKIQSTIAELERIKQDRQGQFVRFQLERFLLEHRVLKGRRQNLVRAGESVDSRLYQEAFQEFNPGETTVPEGVQRLQSKLCQELHCHEIQMKQIHLLKKWNKKLAKALRFEIEDNTKKCRTAQRELDGEIPRLRVQHLKMQRQFEATVRDQEEELGSLTKGSELGEIGWGSARQIPIDVLEEMTTPKFLRRSKVWVDIHGPPESTDDEKDEEYTMDEFDEDGIAEMPTSSHDRHSQYVASGQPSSLLSFGNLFDFSSLDEEPPPVRAMSSQERNGSSSRFSVSTTQSASEHFRTSKHRSSIIHSFHKLVFAGLDDDDDESFNGATEFGEPDSPVDSSFGKVVPVEQGSESDPVMSPTTQKLKILSDLVYSGP